MLRNSIYLLAAAILLLSCKPDAPNPLYKYDVNPTFTWGFAEFFGDYYSNYDNPNNVLSLNLFSEGLDVNKENTLVGTGQYLKIEDIFSSPNDTLLPVGNYKLEETGQPFTFFGGEKFIDNRDDIPSGAYIYYIEPDPSKSKIAYVTDGTMNVSLTENGVYTIQCAFILDRKTEFKGTFSNKLLHIDQAVSTPSGAPRKKIKVAL